MSNIAFTTLLKRQDSKLSPHFGRAKWVTIVDQDGGAPTFVQNIGLNGRAVVEILAAHGCTDVVFSGIGAGALRHLQAANIRGWIGSGEVAVPDLLEKLRRRELPEALASTEGPAEHGCGHSRSKRQPALGSHAKASA
jgi:predicted Fe-Mo cluster-binding NifX family protein